MGLPIPLIPLCFLTEWLHSCSQECEVILNPHILLNTSLLLSPSDSETLLTQPDCHKAPSLLDSSQVSVSWTWDPDAKNPQKSAVPKSYPVPWYPRLRPKAL